MQDSVGARLPRPWRSALPRALQFPPGPWSRALSHEFPSWIQARGLDYLNRGAVRIMEVAQETVTALALGGEDYTVRLRVRGEEMDSSCTCAYFLKNRDGCKHIWAVILAAEEGGHLPPPGSGPAAFRDPGTPRPSAGRPDWLEQLTRTGGATTPPAAAGPGEMLYVVDAAATHDGGGLVLDLATRRRRANGEWGETKARRLRRDAISSLADPDDRAIASLLLGAREDVGWDPYYASGGASRFRLDDALARVLVPMACRTGRARLRTLEEDDPGPLAWDGEGRWELLLTVTTDETRLYVDGGLVRGAETRPLEDAVLLTAGGLVFFAGQAALFESGAGFGWVTALRAASRLEVPKGDVERLWQAISASPRPPRLHMPKELQRTEVPGTFTPRLRITAPDKRWDQRALRCEVSFDYGGAVVPAESPGWGVSAPASSSILVRDRAGESAALERLRVAGIRRGAASAGSASAQSRFEITPPRVAAAVRTLINDGWHVEAEGSLYRPSTALRMGIRTGVDWFDLSGTAEFGEAVVPIPRLLAAIRSGERTLRLDDGSLGMIPEEWVRKYALLSSLAPPSGDEVRFARNQIGLLDALLASQPEVDQDAAFREARARLAEFSGVFPQDAPPGFQGTLREYQRAGLGWMGFLRDFGFGGCLADDMGLGKTVQVLALLERVRTEEAEGERRPSLVVVPRSLIFNWKAEAARFAPSLRVLDHTGMSRTRDRADFAQADVVLTTYGTLRRDALLLKDVPFDTVILDEAQAVKNPGTEAAKAVRLLDARHRLALSGTPVENHLGELVSLFEFLNPGMLGRFRLLRGTAELDQEARELLAQALRPFILRRTKDQVVSDLPQKTEQTLHCELDREQRALYDELRAHYRDAILTRVDRDGMAKSKMHVLEALLRLRQAACHPGLVDPARREAPSAKLDALIPALSEVVAEGHKALVFSQFTSFLALVRERLVQAGVEFEYLDGRTRDRAARVARFQEDPECRVFLVSLKAGGLGLNLTAADYVFLLDPWWNPAVEAQAVDRAHRLGQTRPVFAYRLIARGTVEEKILELQQQKRSLADAILTADPGVLRQLKREDLELLLS